MKNKFLAAIFIAVISTGCASVSDRAVDDFFEGAASNAKSRQSTATNSNSSQERDFKNEVIEDSIAGVLTGVFRNIFDSDNN